MQSVTDKYLWSDMGMILTWENEMRRVKLLLLSLCKTKSHAELLKIKPGSLRWE